MAYWYPLFHKYIKSEQRVTETYKPVTMIAPHLFVGPVSIHFYSDEDTFYSAR